MTWASVRPRLATIIEGVTVPSSVRSAKARGRGDRFRHKPEATDESLPDTRGFWIRVVGMSIKGNTPTGRVLWLHDTVVINIAYRRDNDAQDLDDAIASDYGAIVAELADSANWSTTTSTIVSIGAEGADRYFVAQIDDVEGARILRITCEVEHRQ